MNRDIISNSHEKKKEEHQEVNYVIIKDNKNAYFLFLLILFLKAILYYNVYVMCYRAHNIQKCNICWTFSNNSAKEIYNYLGQENDYRQ